MHGWSGLNEPSLAKQRQLQQDGKTKDKNLNDDDENFDEPMEIITLKPEYGHLFLNNENPGNTK